MAASRLPVEEWFIFRQGAAEAYLGKILREIRWKASGDAFMERLGLSNMGSLVRVLDPGRDFVPNCNCGCRNYRPRCRRPARPPVRCAFRFEMDLGRSNLGHEYLIEVAGSSTMLWRMDKWNDRFELGDLDEVTPENLLQVLREYVILEVMTE